MSFIFYILFWYTIYYRVSLILMRSHPQKFNFISNFLTKIAVDFSQVIHNVVVQLNYPSISSSDLFTERKTSLHLEHKYLSNHCVLSSGTPHSSWFLVRFIQIQEQECERPHKYGKGKLRLCLNFFFLK
jgi:hypothetical protein